MKLLSIVILSIFSAILSAVANAGTGPGTFSYEGRLYDDQGTPVSATNVSFRVQVYDDHADCVLYEETFVKDLSTTRGLFSFQLGSGTVSSTYLTNLRSALVNDGISRTIHGCSYTPASNTDRKIKIAVSEAGGTISEFSDVLTLGSAAYAMTADTLQGLAPADFIRTNASALSQSNIESLFTNTGFANLLKVANGNFTESSAAGAVLPSVTTVPATPPAAGTIWYDQATTKLKYSTGTSIVDLQAPSGSGSLTSVGLSLPSIFAVTGSPVTSSGTFTATLNSQSSGFVFAGPATGSAAPPTFRALASTDLPTNGYDSTYARIDGNTVASSISLGTNSGHGVSLRTNAIARLTIDANGNVGIGTNAPGTRLDVAGGIRIGNESASCSPAMNGTLRNNGTQLEFCDGSTWRPFATSTLTSLNGLSSATQTFGIGTAGASPSWQSASAQHTLNIPMASAAGTTAGLLSNTEYLSLTSKLGTALPSGQVWVGNSIGVAAAVAPSGDASLTNTGSFTVQALRGNTVTAGLPSGDGAVLRWTSAGAGSWTPAFLRMSDIRTNVGANVLPGTACLTSETLAWSSVTDSFVCQTIQIDSTQIAYGTVAQNLVFAGPSSGNGSPTFRTLTAGDLPSGVATQWTTSGTTINYSGKVGIGTATPSHPLDIAGEGTLRLTGAGTGSTSGPAILLRANGSGSSVNANIWETRSSANGLTLEHNLLNDGGSRVPYMAIRRSSSNALVSVGFAAAQFGIGTTNPSGLLEVRADPVTTSAGKSILLNAQSSSNNYGGSIILKPGDSGPGYAPSGVGIGTYSPLATLHVTDSLGQASVRIGDPIPTSQPQLSFYSEAGESRITAGTGGDFEVVPKNGKVSFLAGDTSSVGVSIGGALPRSGSILDLYGTTAMIVPQGTTVERPSPGVVGMIRYNSSDSLFEVYQGGAWRNLSTVNVSDARLKTSIEPISNALSTVDLLKPVSYHWDQSNPRANGLGVQREIGFIAQDLETVLPGVVRVDSEGYRTVDYGKIVSVAIAAIKELKTQLAVSRDANATLKAEVEALKADAAKSRSDMDAMKSYLCTQGASAPWCAH